MKTRIFVAVMALVLFGMSACSPYVDPRHKYPPHYRTYQDRDHGGMDNGHGGTQYEGY